MAQSRATASALSLPSVAAPSAGRAVLLVALRELTDQMTSLRFLTIALLAVGLTPLAIYVGARDFKNRLAEYDRLQVEKQKQSWKDGVTEVGDRENLLLLRAVRAPEPLSVLVRGLDAAMPAYWDFSTAGIASGPSASRPRRLADMPGQLDMEFLVRVVLGLLAILLAFDALFGDPVFLTFLDQGGNTAMAFARRKPPIFSQLPMFVPPRGDALTALARALPSLGLLIVYTRVFIVGSFVAFGRYDVR